MLKLTYTSTGVTLERSAESLDMAIRRRVLLGLSQGQPLGLEPTSISLRVNRSVPALKDLIREASTATTSALRLVPQEAAQQVEMHLEGYWLAQQEPVGEGVFMMNLDPKLEGHLVNVWQTSQQDASCCS